MKEWYCKVNETPGKQEGGTMREEVIWLLEDKDAHFTANWLIADQILALLCEEVERHHSPYCHTAHTNNTFPCKACVWEEAAAGLLALLRGDD